MTKAEIRETVWTRIEDAGVARFPAVRGRVPNFDGAEHAVDRLQELAVWKQALAVHVSSDAPQLPVRRAALAAGKIVYLTVPGLRSERCFVELDPRRLGAPCSALSIVAACKQGRRVSPREMRPIDLVVCGALAVSRRGECIGKGGGMADLAYALLREDGKIREATPIATTVHRIQIVRHRIHMQVHDVPVDFIATPDNVIASRPTAPRPRGVYWDLLRPSRISSVPLLRQRHQRAISTPSPGTP